MFLTFGYHPSWWWNHSFHDIFQLGRVVLTRNACSPFQNTWFRLFIGVQYTLLDCDVLTVNMYLVAVWILHQWTFCMTAINRKVPSDCMLWVLRPWLMPRWWALSSESMFFNCFLQKRAFVDQELDLKILSIPYITFIDSLLWRLSLIDFFLI